MEPKKSDRKGTIFHSGCFGFDTLRFTYIHYDIGLIIVITLDEDKSKQIISGNFPVASGGNNAIIMLAEGCIYSHRN